MSAFNKIVANPKEEPNTTAPKGEKTEMVPEPPVEDNTRGTTAAESHARNSLTATRRRGRPISNVEMPNSLEHIQVDDDLKETFFTRVDENGEPYDISLTSVRLPDHAIQALNGFNAQNNITTLHLIVLGMQKLREEER